MSFFFKAFRHISACIQKQASISILRRLKFTGENIFLGRSVKIEHPEFVSLGDRVYLSDYCWLSVLATNYQVGSPNVSLKPALSIGDGTYIGRFGTIACMNRVEIGNNVLISDRVFIGDAEHGHSRKDIPINSQYMHSTGPVEIKDGTWIGIGVSILPNVRIGRNCVIGAGAVVTHDIPDFSVAVGVPARVIKVVDN